MNVPGEWTLRREFLRLQTTDDREGGREGGHGGGGGQQRQQVGFQLVCSPLHINSYYSNVVVMNSKLQ